ncbi:hypothetical protein EMCRGX_G010567 [Ephydatia muelleri]
MELDREKEFRTFLAEKFPTVKRGTSGVFHKEFGDKIKAAIKDPSSADKNMRFFIKKKGFQILNIPSLGARDVLVIPVKEQDLVEDNTALDKYRRVAHVEEFYDIIRDVHEKELLHGGYKKTFDKIDLIDMRHLPHGNNKWILHCVDHWSKFNFAYALDAKTASNVAGILNTHIFPYFGVPRILHSDNGREFVNMVIVDLLKCWNSNIQLVSGRPRHPQSQGLVERAHQTLHKKMAAEISASGMKTPPWSDWLPRIVYAMNIQVHDTTGASPYELVFGQKARTVIVPTQQNAIVLEDDLADEGIDNVVDEAEEDTLHAEVSAAESETTEREVLEKNDDELNGNELKCNGKRKCLREDALSTSLKHKKIRIKADRKYLSSAKKMAERYNKQHSTLSFVIGESVSVRIPRIDRASSDLSRLPCVVEIVGDQSLYRLRCQHGVLNVCYTAGELEKFNGSVVCTEENWQNQRFISLREAARKQAPWNHFVSNACKCKTGCLNRKCQCVRKNISCSTYCHKSASCSNCPSVTGSSIEVVPTACHEDFDPWSKFCADVGGSKVLKDQLLSSQILYLWQSGSTMYDRSCREDEDLDLSAYLSGPTEYGFHVNAHVSFWLESRSYDKKPSLVQALGFVIVTEEIHKEFDAFVTSMPLLSKGCYFQCGPLLQYWNMHMRPISASVVSLFAGEYLYLHYSEVDDLCEWVLNAREAFEKHTQSAEYPFEHPVESEEKGIITKRKCSSRTPKLWMTCGELKLYEADRVVLESNQSWLNDNIINAAQNLLKTKVSRIHS